MLLQDPKDTPPPTRAETRDERRERKRREKAEQVAYKLEQEIAMCNFVFILKFILDSYVYCMFVL